MGLTVTITAIGDYLGRPNTQNIIFFFGANGVTGFKRWDNSSTDFVTGTAVTFACPES
jgi:hypothetical protein